MSMHQTDITLTLTRIARTHLGIGTLEPRHADRLDFHEVAVWSLRDALEAAFQAGVTAGKAKPKAAPSDIGNG